MARAWPLLLTGLACLAAAGPVLPTVAARAATPSNTTERVSGVWSEKQQPAPVDYGFGPGVAPPRSSGSILQRLLGTTARPLAAGAPIIPNGGASAATAGFFGAPVSWPIIMVHLVLLPDGRVMSYGTDQKGNQGAQLLYDVWDPTQGTGTSAHTLLPNTTTTDIFCSAQSVLANGTVLLTGGDLTVGGVRNYSNNKTTIFTPTTNSLATAKAMTFARWYPTIVPMPNGARLVIGGRQNPSTPVQIAELYGANAGWTVMWNAPTPAFNTNEQWFYPRAFLGQDGYVYILNFDSSVLKMGIKGNGSVTTVSPAPLINPSDHTLPAAMFAPGKILAVRANNTAEVVNINGTVPVSTPTASTIQGREWSSETVLPDGTVLLTGGSGSANVLTNMGYASEIWNPVTGQWTVGAASVKARLYHSNALLLQDGTVLTGGGGAPGPVTQLNAEIYYPPYLYANDGSGNPAPRPTVVAAPAVATAGQVIAFSLASSDPVSRVTFVRAGSATHSFNTEQRFLDLTSTMAQTGPAVTVTLPTSQTVLVPGRWLLFAFNSAGVPSVASIINVLPTTL